MSRPDKSEWVDPTWLRIVKANQIAPIRESDLDSLNIPDHYEQKIRDEFEDLDPGKGVKTVDYEADPMHMQSKTTGSFTVNLIRPDPPSNETTNNSNSDNTDMSRSWEDNEVEGGLGELAGNDEHFDDSGTVDLGSGTQGGEYNVTPGGHTVTDEQVANSDQLTRTGNDTVAVTGNGQSNQQSGNGALAGVLNGDDNMMLVVAVAAAAALAWGVSR